MGMFSSLFGSSGSDKADKLRQQAIDAFYSIRTPELSDLQVQLDKYVQAGTITPEQAEVALLGSNAFNDIVTDPSYVGAQKQALQQMQQIATEGGLTAIDKAQLNDITNQQNQQNRSQNAATMQQAQQRGVGGSDLNVVNQLINEQGAADRAANQGLGVAAQAQARALAAMQAAGQQGGQLEAQQYGEQANKAQAANAIDLFNKQALNQTNLYNTQNANQAQAANLANQQAIMNANTGTANVNKQYNAQQVQQRFNDEMAKAQGVAGTYNAWANDAQQQAAREKGADMGIASGLLQTGATALGATFGGPAGAVAANQAFAPKNPTEERFDRGYAEGGEVTMDKEEFKDEHTRLLDVLENQPRPIQEAEAEKQRDEMKEYNLAKGGEVCCNKGGVCMKHGGQVAGQAKVAGDSPKNDTVDAKLSPGEIVVPRSATNDDEEFERFMEKFRPSKQKANQVHIPTEARALANMHNRLKKLEEGGSI